MAFIFSVQRWLCWSVAVVIFSITGWFRALFEDLRSCTRGHGVCEGWDVNCLVLHWESSFSSPMFIAELARAALLSKATSLEWRAANGSSYRNQSTAFFSLRQILSSCLNIYIRKFTFYSKCVGNCEMLQLVNCLLCRPSDPSLIPRTHVKSGRGKLTSQSCPLTSNTHAIAKAPPPTPWNKLSTLD